MAAGRVEPEPSVTRSAPRQNGFVTEAASGDRSGSAGSAFFL